MARPRTPPAIKALQGNPSNRWQDLEAGIILPAELPEPPAGLSEEVKVRFIETAKLLFALGTMTRCDVEALVRYATYAMLLGKAHKDLERMPYVGVGPTGRVQYNPAIKLITQIVPLQTKFETEMGMTAAARSRINLGQPKKTNESPAQKYLT